MMSPIIYSGPLLATGIGVLLLAGAVWKRRAAPAAAPLLGLLAGLAFWCIPCAFELFSTDLGTRLLWMRLELPAIASLPACYLLVAIQYSGRRLSGIGRALLFTIPAAVQVIAWNPGWHHLYWRRIWIETSGPLPLTGLEWGPAFWVVVGNNWIAVAIAFYLIVRHLVRSKGPRKREAAIFLAITSFPILVNFADVLRLTPASCPDLTPFAFALTGAGIAWVLFRYRFQAIVPVAWKTVIESMEDAELVLDSDTRVLAANPAAERLLGRSNQELIGRPLGTTLNGCPALLRFAEVEHGEGDIEVERAGVQQICEVRVSPVVGRRGPQIGRLLTVRDVTSQRAMARELEKSRYAAEAANRAKSEFLANMSHEIRTPMNGVIGMTELALGTPLNGEQREYLQLAKSSADSLMAVINDILDFSKIEAGKMELETLEFEMREFLQPVLKTFGVRTQEKKLELLCDIRPEVPAVVAGDPGRLRQVIVNLLGNAVKFTRSGEIEVGVAVESEEVEAGTVSLEFSIRDTGIGIPGHKKDLIFEAFSQADTSTTREFGGTGLGLTICSRLVEMMGGRIWVDSEPQVGSTFHFTARLGVVKDGAREAVPVLDLAGRPVLVVDDNATNRRILGDVLRRWGAQPALFEDSAAALEELRRLGEAGSDLPLVITDGHMPGLDGFHFAAAIRRDERLRGAQVIMLTSACNPGDVAASRDLGLDAYLMKPIGQEELRAALTRVLGLAESRAAVRASAAEDSMASYGEGLRVLVVEDNPVNQRLAVRLLEKAGHWAGLATNGREALEILRTERFDAILMDAEMPEMDGLEATAAIRALERQTGKRVPIIALTAHALVADRERFLAAGMDDYLPKPINARDLAKAIARATRGRPHELTG